jgi:hypothetical protein
MGAFLVCGVLYLAQLMRDYSYYGLTNLDSQICLTAEAYDAGPGAVGLGSNLRCGAVTFAETLGYEQAVRHNFGVFDASPVVWAAATGGGRSVEAQGQAAYGQGRFGQPTYVYWGGEHDPPAPGCPFHPVPDHPLQAVVKGWLPGTAPYLSLYEGDVPPGVHEVSFQWWSYLPPPPKGRCGTWQSVDASASF